MAEHQPHLRGQPKDGANPMQHSGEGQNRGVPAGISEGDSKGRPTAARKETETGPTDQGASGTPKG